MVFGDNGRCLETMDFVDFLLCCIQNTQNCVAKALVPVLNAPELIDTETNYNLGHTYMATVGPITRGSTTNSIFNRLTVNAFSSYIL